MHVRPRRIEHQKWKAAIAGNETEFAFLSGHGESLAFAGVGTTNGLGAITSPMFHRLSTSIFSPAGEINRNRQAAVHRDFGSSGTPRTPEMFSVRSRAHPPG